MAHIHKFRRHTFTKRDKSKYDVFFCVDDCTYQVKRPLALGKVSRCWRCNKPFAMNEYSLRLAKPHCPNCTTGKHGEPKEVRVEVKLPESKTETKTNAQLSEPDDLRARLLATIGLSLTDTDDDLL